MAYYNDEHRSPQQQQHQHQPYEQQASINNNNSNNAYGSPQPTPQSTFFQPPYPDHYDSEPGHPQSPSQPQYQTGGPPPPAQTPIRPLPNGNVPTEQIPDPARFFQPSTAPLAQGNTAAYQIIPAGTAPGNGSAVSPYLSPEIISQITATVIQQLRGVNLESAPGAQQQQPRPPHPSHPSQNADLPQIPHSILTQSDYSPSTGNPNVYTPPSPYKSPEQQHYSSPTLTQPQYRPHSRMHRRPTPEQDKRPQTPYAGMDAQQRPGLGSRHSTREETTMERIWGLLFDREGKPTQRLGQFLRGIAVHLIEAYPPGNTIVVTPEKMQKYYEDTKVPGDSYPWMDIFDDRTSSISRLYRDVQAEHHLVQERLDEKPDIPGLTARGFERWMTLMIQAHPDQEFERLQRTLLEMPINNPDDSRERFPKELSRRLFPKAGDPVVKALLEQGMVTHCKIKPSVFSPRSPSRAGIHHNRGASFAEGTSGKASPLGFDRRRHTYTPAIEEAAEGTPSRPIERERKPYSAQPGGGKLYEDVTGTRVTSPVDIPDPTNNWDPGVGDSLGGHKQGSDSLRGLYGRANTPGAFPGPLDELRYGEGREGDNDNPYGPPGRDRDKVRNDHQPRVSWENDEDFYRGPGLLREELKRHASYDNDPWPGRY